FMELAVQDHLGVAGALEFFIDHVIYPGAGVDKAGREDRERSSAFDVSRRAEEALRRVQRDGVHTTRHRSTGRRDREVVRTREARDRVEKDDDVPSGLDETL